MLALVEFSVKARLSCGKKRDGDSTWFKGKENYQFSVFFFLVWTTGNTSVFTLV